MSGVGDLGRRVTERRQELGLSPEEVATRAGMDPSYVRTLEASASPQLSTAALWRLAAALETTVDVITGGGTQLPPGRAEASKWPALDALDSAECWSLISAGGVGRVVFDAARGPVALPVNFRIFDGDVVFRTAPLTELASAMERGAVSFEVDHIDEALAEGWSVLISGEGCLIVDPDEYQRAQEIGVTPWTGGDRDAYVRIVSTEVTGRRIRRR